MIHWAEKLQNAGGVVIPPRVLTQDAAEGWWCIFVNAEILHVNAWLLKWVSRLLNSPCDNLLMIRPNSVESRRCLSRWYFSCSPLLSSSSSPQIPLPPQPHWRCDTEMTEIVSDSGHLPCEYWEYGSYWAGPFKNTDLSDHVSKSHENDTCREDWFGM